VVHPTSKQQKSTTQISSSSGSKPPNQMKTKLFLQTTLLSIRHRPHLRHLSLQVARIRRFKFIQILLLTASRDLGFSTIRFNTLCFGAQVSIVSVMRGLTLYRVVMIIFQMITT